MADQWREGITAAAAQLDAINRRWMAIARSGATRRGPTARCRRRPPVVRAGTVALELAALAGRIATDSRLMVGVPASVTFAP